MATTSTQGGGYRSNGKAIELSIAEFIKSSGHYEIVTREEATAKGYFSVKDFADKTRYSTRHSRSVLEQGLKLKTLEEIKVKEAGGRFISYFRPIKKKK